MIADVKRWPAKQRIHYANVSDYSIEKVHMKQWMRPILGARNSHKRTDMKNNEINTTTEVIAIANSNTTESAKRDQSAGVKALAPDQLLFVSGGDNAQVW